MTGKSLAQSVRIRALHVSVNAYAFFHSASIYLKCNVLWICVKSPRLNFNHFCSLWNLKWNRWAISSIVLRIGYIFSSSSVFGNSMAFFIIHFRFPPSKNNYILMNRIWSKRSFQSFFVPKIRLDAYIIHCFYWTH